MHRAVNSHARAPGARAARMHPQVTARWNAGTLISCRKGKTQKAKGKRQKANMSPVGHRRLQIAQLGEVAALRLARVRQPPLQGHLFRLRARQQPAQGFNGCSQDDGPRGLRLPARQPPRAAEAEFSRYFLPGNWPPPPPPLLPMPAVSTSGLGSETTVCIWSKLKLCIRQPAFRGRLNPKP